MSIRLPDGARLDLMNCAPWLIGNFIRTGNEIQIGGWAIPPNGNVNATTFTIDGRVPDEVRLGLPTEHLAKTFFFVPNSAFSGFIFKAKLTEAELGKDLLRVSFVNKYTLAPFSRWHDIYLPAEDQPCIEPEASRMVRTVGYSHFWKYRMMGYTLLTHLQSILRTYFQRDLSSFQHIVDWGSGCARLTQLLLHRAPASTIVGLDIDGDNVAWCDKNIKGVDFKHCNLEPPVDLPDASVDLLVGISVITHLTLEMQRVWRKEIARIVKPGGVVVLSFNGEFVMAKAQEAQILAAAETGFDAESSDSALNGYIGDNEYYRLTMQTQRHFRNEFSEDFEVVDVIHAGCTSVQDFAIMIRR